MNAKCITSGSDDSLRIGRQKLPNDKPGPIPLPSQCTIKLIALGWKHGHIVINDNQMYSWGLGKSYRLGTGNKNSSEFPIKVSLPKNFEIQMIAAGDAFGCAISSNGKLLAWGRKYAKLPTDFPLQSPAKYLSCGGISILCALADGSLQLLTSSESSRNIKIPDEKVIMTAAGTTHYVALTAAGTVYSWGTPCSSGHPKEKSVPTILRFSPTPVAAVFAYQDNSWFVDKMNNVYRCGKNEEGCLGSGDVVPISSPTKLEFDFNESAIIQIACGDNFTIVLTDSGMAYAAGCTKECRSAIDPSCYNDSKYFQKCTFGIDQKVTQVACGCYSGAFVIDGEYHPCNKFFERTFKDYPVASGPSEYFLIKDHPMILNPKSPLLDEAGLKSEDIIKFGDGTQAKVIGVSNENHIVTVTDRIACREIETTDFKSVFETIELKERPNHKISSFKTDSGKIVQIDISDEELFKFKGVKYNDMLLDGSNIAGVRGSHLFTYRKVVEDKILTELDPSQLSSVIRNQKTLKPIKFINIKDEMLTEKDDNSDDIWSLYYDNLYGAGICLGTVHNHFAYQFASEFGAKRLLKDQCQTVRMKDKFMDVFLMPSFEKISISIAPSTLINNNCKTLYPFDFVNTPDGFGCIAGFYKDQVAIWLENNIAYRGTVSLYSMNDVDPKARLFAPLIIDGMSANSSDFTEFHLLPGDQIEIENDLSPYLVVGTKDNKIFAEVNGDIKEIDWKKAKLVQRHLYVGSTQDDDVLKISNHYECSSRILVSSALANYGESTEKGKVIGLLDQSTLLLKNESGQYISSGFSLPKID